MKIIVGLGNPGKEYARTRHNIGFMVLDRLRKDLANPTERNRFRSTVVEGFVSGEKVVMVAPLTYMNLSGHAVREVRNWYRAADEDMLIVFDDMDLPFGTLRMRADGSAGGHNGLASIIEQLGSRDIPRLRVGIGRGRSGSVGHVLSRFSPEEEAELPDVIERAALAVDLWRQRGAIAAMNEINRKAVDTVPSTKRETTLAGPSATTGTGK
jgi:PTH1 family peptidyl-tRNA hydrolase